MPGTQISLYQCNKYLIARPERGRQIFHHCNYIVRLTVTPRHTNGNREISGSPVGTVVDMRYMKLDFAGLTIRLGCADAI